MENKVVANQTILDSMIKYYEKNLGEDFSVISSKVQETNNCKGIELQFRDLDSGYYYYGDVSEYYSDNYIHRVIIVSSTKEYLTSSERNNIIKSLKVKDTVLNSNGIPFMDISKNDWYYNSVKYVSNNKIITGTTPYTYNPNGKLTRGQLATIIWRMAGMPKVKGKEFPDVKTTDYYYQAIQWASANKIVNGYATGKFGPKDNVTREQLAVMLQNYAKYKKKNVNDLANISEYSDIKKVSSYAINAVRWAIHNKIISGKEGGTKIDPKGNATRAEVAAMIQNYYIYIK